MSRSNTLSLIPLILVLAVNVLCQNKATHPNPQIASSPAYAEVLLHKTELEAELESLLTEYTEEYPKIKDLRAELEVLKPEIDRILAVKPADAGKLTQALGRLILGKVAHAATLKKLQSQFQDVHPNVKKEKRMVEIFEAAIKEILG